eukprot:Tamp_11298.p2 GENE.Tamp_11298~~Tamp_11298.p2  ORF type:complete len:393 (-),score=73.56 Tamp_11298:485-1663(-)
MPGTALQGGGVEMVIMSSRQLANDGIDPDEWGGESEMLLDQAGGKGAGEHAGLMHSARIDENREKSCIYMLVLLAAWVLVGIVFALASSLKAAFPLTPENEHLPQVPHIVLSAASWVREGAHIGPGGDVIVPVAANASAWQSLAGAAMAQSQIAVVPDAEAFSAVLEGSIEPGQWIYHKYRQKSLNNVSESGAEFHLRVPQLDNLLHDAAGAASACPGGAGQRRAIALARVGSAPSLAQHDSSSCNGCEQGQAGKEATCGLICGADLWVYVAIFAPLAEIPSPAPPQPVPFSFRIRVAGMRMQHVLDLPTCAFAQEGHAPKMLYFVFLPSLFAGLPLLAVLVGCAVLRSWMLHSGRSARGLNQMLASSAPAPAPPRHARHARGSHKGKREEE